VTRHLATAVQLDQLLGAPGGTPANAPLSTFICTKLTPVPLPSPVLPLILTSARLPTGVATGYGFAADGDITARVGGVMSGSSVMTYEPVAYRVLPLASKYSICDCAVTDREMEMTGAVPAKDQL